MAKRKSLGQRSRFEVFKRDGFKCQYCGRNPPEAILQVDHIVAVANGGSDDRTNLVTSCRDCNLGKADVPLNCISRPIEEQLATEVERREQLEAFNRWLLKHRRERTIQARKIGVYWNNLWRPEHRDRFTFGESRMRSVETFLKHLPQARILDAVDQAFGKVPPPSSDDDRTFKYFCGICWGVIKTNRGEAAQ